MIDQHDTQLQRIFDERLMRVLPPPRTPRRRGRPGRVLGAALAVLLAGTSLALVADVNRTADTAGESCASVLARVELWWETVKSRTTAQQLEFKRQAADLVGQSCAEKGAVKDPNAKKPEGATLSKPSRPQEEASPECLAAKLEANRLVSAQSNPTEADQVALKKRISAMLEAACTH